MKKDTPLLSFLRVAALATAMLAVNAQAGAGDLYESDLASGTIFRFTPAGVKSTFATGLSNPVGLAFDRKGDLFVADANSGSVFEFNAAGVQSTFASGISGGPAGLA